MHGERATKRFWGGDGEEGVFGMYHPAVLQILAYYGAYVIFFTYYGLLSGLAIKYLR